MAAGFDRQDVPESVQRVTDAILHKQKEAEQALKQERKEVDGDAVTFARVVLDRWCTAAGYDARSIDSDEFGKLAAWIAAYCINRNNPAIVDRPRQCLWLCGGCGRGKTHLARILRDRLQIPMRNADDISRDVTTDDMTAYDRRLYTTAAQDLIIDDLGAEELRSSYGNTTEMPQLLCRLYELWRYSGKLLIVTSNYGLSGDWLADLNARYGERVTDRLVEMFMPVKLTGKNWRRDNG